MLIIATNNPGKFERYKTFLSEMETVQKPALHIEEGANGRENAERKARAYREAYGLPALGIDEELFVNFTEEQPGAYIRRIGKGQEVSDEQLRNHYLSLIRKASPGKRTGRFHHNLCLALLSGEIYAAFYDEPLVFTHNPSASWKRGYPLSSLIIGRAALEGLQKVVKDLVRNV